MKIGHIIKTKRIKIGMKQIVLAKGICAPSYLSRIEQDQIIASKEIISLLLKRLDIDIDKVIITKVDSRDTVVSKIHNAYQEVICRRDSNYADKWLKDFQDNYLFENSEIYYTINLTMLRFRLIAGHDIVSIEGDIELFSKQKSAFNQRQRYLLLINEGILLYKKKNIRLAILKFEKVIDMKIQLEAWEQAELNYMIGLAYVAENRIAMSLAYIDRALNYYKDKIMIRRVLDCYMLKGIMFKRMNDFVSGERCYLECIELCNKFGIPDRLGGIYHNLGSLYLSNGMKTKGISYMIDCLKYKNEDESKLTTILALVVEYSKMGNAQHVIRWCNEGISIYMKKKCKTTKPFYNHFIFYSLLHSENGVSVDDSKKTINYFISLHNYSVARNYAIQTAKQLYINGKYKSAATFFMKANKLDSKKGIYE